MHLSLELYMYTALQCFCAIAPAYTRYMLLHFRRMLTPYHALEWKSIRKYSCLLLSRHKFSADTRLVTVKYRELGRSALAAQGQYALIDASGSVGGHCQEIFIRADL